MGKKMDLGQIVNSAYGIFAAFIVRALRGNFA